MRTVRSNPRPPPFLKPETRSWPVGDKRHAKIAIQYMTRGFGNHAEYPMLLSRLAQIWPVDDPRNADLWDMYHRNRDKIDRWIPKRAAANPSPYYYIVYWLKWSGPIVVSRHRNRDAAERALPLGPAREHGCYVAGVETTPLASPLPVRVGQRVKIVRGIAIPLDE